MNTRPRKWHLTLSDGSTATLMAKDFSDAFRIAQELFPTTIKVTPEGDW